VVTIAIGALALIATLVAMASPAVHAALDGTAPREHPWQPVTAAFLHGWPGMPALFHLAMNLVLLAVVGPMVERVLGTSRMLILSLAALAANALTVHLTDGANGTSLILWAWGPPLYVALRADVAGRTLDRSRGRGILGLMYVGIPVLLTGAPYLAGWRGSPLVAFGMANAFHAVATAVGVGLAIAWRDRIRSRVARA